MADVSRRDRGQLFLVGALVIATLLVVLALFLNSGIYAQNLSARNADPGVTGAVEYRGATADATNEMVVRLNAEDPANATHADLHANLTTGIQEWSNATAIHGAYRGKGREVALHKTKNGTLIRQDSDREFTNKTGTGAEWRVVEEADAVRGFRMNVTQGDLIDVSGLALSGLASSNAFRANITADTETYTVYVGRTTTDEVNVTVDHPTGSSSCEVPFDGTNRATINVTNASIEGEHCGALAELSDDDDDDFTVDYENASSVNGTYELVVLDADQVGSGDDYNTDPADGSPWKADVIYSAEVDIFYRAREVAYETRVEVVPEEELT